MQFCFILFVVKCDLEKFLCNCGILVETVTIFLREVLTQCLQFCYLLSWSGGHCRLRSTSYKACTFSLCPPLCSWFTVNWIIRCQCTAHPVRYLGRDISETSRVSVSLQTSITAVYIIHPLLLATALCFYKALSTFPFYFLIF